MECKGQFLITRWEEETLSEKCEGVKTSHASISQAYSGDMAGEADIEFLMSYQSPAEARFTGFESFVGVINGLRGTVTLVHSGKFTGGVASSEFNAIASSATGELAGKEIHGHFQSSEAGKANYTIFID
ncbi:DUF3224 domain-containing protein [Alteromonas sp. McT4-15]|jgi:hypothetical protein|uniref:DUF3224 domain-containing protein n=1 Tax=Alteromonas sp. McT4-15 TaxID=2881256 RepID=UPI0012E6A8DF|nr:DUF3224 domain-containing protein [Alteromonas sp. McT4-15]MCB4436642.1 DUF3224 domain-containing protein [Alteromonas sp. McT4-15]MEC8231270.1 DUF3224 domain-containing protein [Pseudomonadota bacterium]GFD91155.1 hypothetical protein KUL152_33810 [Tenacibaculum sp. KUL152]